MCLYPGYVRNGKFVGGLEKPLETDVAVPCGNCVECLNDKSLEWTYRVWSEFVHAGKVGCVLTLTYDNEHVPANYSVSRPDLTKFIKRLRKFCDPVRLKFFGCAEYGTRNGRPHYHLVLIGWQPSDMQLIKRSAKDTLLYRSKIVEKIWGQGICSVSYVNTESIKYCTKYLQKLYFDGSSEQVPPFLAMSTHPGFGAFEALEKVKSDSVYLNGVRRKVPRYYLKLAEKNGIDLVALKEKRKQTALVMKEVLNPLLKKKRVKFELKILRDQFVKSIDNNTQMPYNFIVE